MQSLNTALKHFHFPLNCLLLTVLAFSFCALLITVGCGKRKPPLPPIETVVQRIDISGKQFGNIIFLSWVMPARNVSDSNVLNISRADLYRIIEKDDSPLTLTEEEFANNSTLIASIPISDADFAKKTMIYKYELKFSGQSIRLRYALRFVNSSGQKAAFSNFLIIKPNANIAEAPKSLSAELTEKAIVLNWTEPTANIDGSIPANIIGYNIYRFTDKRETARLLNKSPITSPNYFDKTFEFGKEYSYFIRTISLGNEGEAVESIESNTITILPKDTFAPAAPTSITIAAASNILSIFFAVNLEKDIAGYRVYRSIDKNLPKAEWLLLTSDPIKTNTFQDKTVESGKTYFYYLLAIDSAGNVSSPSEIVSETVP
ncbi:hypothetical protein BH10ACI1_BH10ACI1_14630 [soil metagenome]